jgi:cell division protein FtsB
MEKLFLFMFLPFFISLIISILLFEWIDFQRHKKTEIEEYENEKEKLREEIRELKRKNEELINKMNKRNEN